MGRDDGKARSKPARLSRDELEAALAALYTWLDDPEKVGGLTPGETEEEAMRTDEQIQICSCNADDYGIGGE